MAWLAQYMESHDMDIDLRDHCGHTPLHLAARAGHASAVAILVAHGADVTAKVRSKVIRFLSVAPSPPAADWCAVSSKSIDSHVCLWWFIYGTFQSNGHRLRPSNWPRPSPAKRWW